jgi:hypothetical protein
VGRRNAKHAVGRLLEKICHDLRIQ